MLYISLSMICNLLFDPCTR